MESGSTPGSRARPPAQRIVVRRLDARDAEAFMALRSAALLAEPLAFGSSPQTDRFRVLENTLELLERGDRAAMFGAFDGERLVGCVGLVCEAGLKVTHRATVWGMYVDANVRGCGAGAALMHELVAHARTLAGIEWLQLDVSTVAGSAQRLYERCGFETWGREPDGLRADGRSTDVLHMALRLANKVES